MRISLGTLSALPRDRARVVPFHERSIIVIRTNVGVRAYWNECKHNPAPLDDGSGDLPIVDALVCRSHGARYTLEDGLCFLGPCRGKFLDAVKVIVEGDEIIGEL